jgi:hypothetical protein
MATVRIDDDTGLRIGALCIHALFNACRLLSAQLAALHWLALRAGLCSTSTCLHRAPSGLYRTLERIWFTLALRRALILAVKTPLRGATLNLVNETIPAPLHGACIIAIPHSPWMRLLAEWCREREFALVLAGGIWTSRTTQVNVAGGVRGLRQAIRHLRAGGRVVVVADVFWGPRHCPVRFLGKNLPASLTPARLSALSGVPLQAVVPMLHDGRIHLDTGPGFVVAHHPAAQAAVTCSLLAFLERRIRQQPEIYNHILKIRGTI